MSKDQATERFVNRKQAFDWLVAQGYKVSRGKFYQDCAAGCPVVHRDGSVSKFEVLQYGQQLDVTTRLANSDYSRENEAKKLKAEAEMAEMKAEKMRREEDKHWLHADTAWAITAGLIGSLRDCIRHHLYTARSEVVLQADGKQDRDQEVFELMDEVIDRAFNEVAGESVNVVFEKETD